MKTKQEKQIDGYGPSWGKDRSICCDSPMTGGIQCVVCGADGREPDEEEKQEMIDEKIRFDTNQQII